MADDGKHKYTSSELNKWLVEKASETRSPTTARKILVNNDQRGRSTTILGRMYFYKYEPKYGDRMSQYDKFPMCIPIKRYQNGFMGLNLHYLTVGGRQRMIELLSRYNSEYNITNTSRFNVTYDTLFTSQELENLGKPCVHRYLWSQCRSRFIEIYPTEYDKAIQLPVENWVFNH